MFVNMLADVGAHVSSVHYANNGQFVINKGVYCDTQSAAIAAVG